MKKIAFEMKP